MEEAPKRVTWEPRGADGIGLMIEGEAKPPIKRGFASSSIGKPIGRAGVRKQETQARSKQGGRADNNKNRCRFDYYRRHLKQGSPKKSNIPQAKNSRTGAGRIIFRRREALLRGSPLGGRWVAGLMIEGEAKPPIKRGFASSSIGKPAGWAGGLREEQEDGCVEDNF